MGSKMTLRIHEGTTITAAHVEQVVAPGLEPAGTCQIGCMGVVTVHQLEAGTSEPHRATLEVVRRPKPPLEFIDETAVTLGAMERRKRKTSRESKTACGKTKLLAP